MDNILIVVDMQNDFITGALGTAEAEAIVPAVKDLVKKWNGTIYATLDTHNRDYDKTHEGKNLPVPHCIEYTDGWLAPKGLQDIYQTKVVNYLRKNTFGSTDLVRKIEHCGYPTFYLCGVCTDICVVSNALLLRAVYSESDIYVVEDCCAGTTPENHESALRVMESCQIKVVKSGNVNLDA